MTKTYSWMASSTNESIALLVPELAVSKLEQYYISYLKGYNLKIVGIPLLKYKKKTPASDIKQYLQDEVEPILQANKCKYVLVADAEYFKVIRKVTKPDAYIGYIYDNVYKYIYLPNYKMIFYHPEETKDKITRSLNALINDLNNTYTSPGSNIIKSEKYPFTYEDIKNTLNSLLSYPQLTCDIETYSLKHIHAGLGSICFCWNQNEGIAFKIDTSQTERNEPVRELLKNFFINYKGTLIFHNIAFDVTVLVYQLFMNDKLDQEGLLNGLDIMLRDFEDTKLITYLCTNSCSGNNLSLKYQAQEYAGNWAQEEITNLSAIPLEDLLRYNLIDGLSTWFVFNKYKDKLVQDKQDTIYKDIFKPTTKDIIQMQLTGIPLDMNQVKKVRAQLESEQNRALYALMSSPIIINFEKYLNNKWVDRKNSEYKVKRVTLADAHESFNPNSNLQLRELFYDELGLPVLTTTKSKEPSTSSDTIKALINCTNNPDIKAVLQALIDYSDVDKILTAFIPAFEKAYAAPDGWHYLFGNFNLGGTVSGRLSSSNPNLQNIPATGSKYAKTIKSCFKAPPGWLLCGLDFASLEDHISALLTKDKNKLKVYTDHYDGHCLRAYSYWKKLMPDITKQLDKLDTTEQIYKVTYDDGSVKYLTESEIKELQK